MGTMVDGVTLKLADLDLEFIATKAMNVSHKNNPERALIRHNWIEIFIRLCQTKYVKNLAGGPGKTQSECFELMLNQHVLPCFRQFDCHAWRKRVCWVEEVDLAFKRSLSVLRIVYNRWIGRFNEVGKPKFMSLAEFTDCISEINIFNEDFGVKQLAAAFNLSMMTQVEEIESERHINMNFVEFLEALVRVAEKVQIPHLVEVSYTF